MQHVMSQDFAHTICACLFLNTSLWVPVIFCFFVVVVVVVL